MSTTRYVHYNFCILCISHISTVCSLLAFYNAALYLVWLPFLGGGSRLEVGLENGEEARDLEVSLHRPSEGDYRSHLASEEDQAVDQEAVHKLRATTDHTCQKTDTQVV